MHPLLTSGQHAARNPSNQHQLLYVCIHIHVCIYTFSVGYTMLRNLIQIPWSGQPSMFSLYRQSPRSSERNPKFSINIGKSLSNYSQVISSTHSIHALITVTPKMSSVSPLRSSLSQRVASNFSWFFPPIILTTTRATIEEPAQYWLLLEVN